MTIENKGLKLFAFSDTHGMYRRLAVPAESDILICAGDACEGFNQADLEDFFAWFAAIPAKLRIFVPGNHDRIFNTNQDRARSLIPNGVVYMENDGFEYDGIKFFSVPARPYLNTPAPIPAGVDFLITHGPAYSYLDRDMGCKQLYMSVASAKPKYHIFGHVHEDGLKRKAMLGGTTFLNVSYFEELRKTLQR